jgi:Arc/MetJ family transcription regulator
MSFHKTTVEIDTEALAKAEIALGTSGIKETVNRALAEVNRRDALERAAQYVEDGQLRVPDEQTLAAWRASRS